MARDKYEISLWEDYIVAATSTIPEHFEERKLVIIGSDTMTAACRAYEPKLVENINGTNTFTFKMFYVYTDEQTGEKRQNPFLNLLINERKVKAYWKKRWYDLVIKNIQEDSSGKSITYTCKDLFVNELSKNGFNLEFDNELENNQGTVIELGARVLEGTDWQLDGAGSDSIKQEKEEPLYVATVKSGGITAINQKTGTSVPISAGKTIYIFYSCVQNKSNPCQFLYDSTQQYNRDTNSQLIIDVPCFSVSTTWSNATPPVPSIVATMGDQVSNEYRGSRLVDSQKTILDPLTDKYVKIYEANADGVGYSEGDIIYGYESIEYKDPTFVNSLIVNSKNFASTEGWIGTTDDIVGPFQLYPPYKSTSDISTYSAKSYLKFKSGTIYNTGLRESSNYIPDGIQNGEKYVFRFKATTDSSGPTSTYVTNGRIVPHIYKYNYNSGNIVPNTTNDYISRSSVSRSGNWVEYICTCQKSFGRNQIYSDNIGLFFTVSSSCWVEEIEFFPYILGEKSENGQIIQSRINPGEMDWSSVATTYYHYYNHTTHSGVISLEDYLYIGEIDWPNKPLIAQSNDFAKVRSITAKQSNRFNLLQTLAETFECWCQFEIQHDEETGRVIYSGGVPQKFVRFKEKIGQEVGIGFIYGIDLKTISRTIQSDQIVTKTIVSQNNNEFATNGFCTIARSPENYARDTFILNFDYYITQGLIDGGQLNKDLYAQFNGNINQGYYSQLRELNIEYDELTEILVQKRLELTKQESYKTVYENYITSLKEEKNNIETFIMGLANVTTWSGAQKYIKDNSEQPEIKTRMNARQNCIQNLSSYQAMYDGITSSINNLSAIISQKEQDQRDLIGDINALNYAFYRKYSTYIQEGSWIDENYVDDTLYYLDAQSVAYTSSRPQISYNISVARLSSLEEFKSKVFHLGDISYIQDTEFFGYVTINNLKTPYKEQVLISEVISNFDDPIQDSFKVQNYKTQFEDLFQRITATTQSLQYASGEYEKAASIVDTNGTIKFETLQGSININNNLVLQSNNEQIFQDSTGITVTDATNPNKKTKITSGGVFISTDGGATWKNAIRGEGIATQYLTAGNINVQNITLLDGMYQTFRWDSTGINAYDQLRDESTGNLYGIDLSKAVRFDRFGVYGVNGVTGDAATYVPSSEDDIWRDASFGMTWKGFFLHNKYGKYNIEVSSTDDIRIVQVKDDNDNILQNSIERIKIGLLDSQNDVYGFRIKNGTDKTVLETIENGTLWIKDKLYIGTSVDQSDYTPYYAGIGYLPLELNPSKQINWNETNLDTRTISEQSNTIIHRTIDINDKFVVWEDGTMYAKDGYFEGDIYATDGYFQGTINAIDGVFTGTVYATDGELSGQLKVGNITLGQLADNTYRVVILSSQGTIFKNGLISTVLTAELYQGSTKITDGRFTYNWLINGVQPQVPITTKQITVNENVSGTITYDCIIAYTAPT